jgi:hypothetical protein
VEETVIPEAIGVAAQAIVANAKRLGLTWTLRMATVREGEDPTNILAIYDGDTEPIGMTSMVGLIAPDSRVYVLQVPPGGNYIVGGQAGYALGEEGVNLGSASGETVSTTAMSTIPNSTFTLIKYGFGRTRIDMTGTFFTTAATTGAGFGVSFDGTDYLITGVWHNLTANAHTTFAGHMILDAMPPGPYTVIGRWRASINAAGPTRNSSDFLSIMARELAT